MYNYKTVEEKAAEWEVSTRYVQALCRQGKFEGAIKRAGVWFIPEASVNPKKNTTSNDRYLCFSGTKKKIFEKAVKLFSQNSYDFVTIKDIADAVGIRQSAVYNHFKSKQEILDTIYDFYAHYYIKDRPTIDELEPVLRNGTLLEIINSVIYEFNEEYRDLLIDISKIVFYRKFMDERAKELSKKFTVEEGIEFVEALFIRAVEIGRLAPLDAHAMAVFCNSVRMFVFHNLLLETSPEDLKKWLVDEQKLFEYATKLLTDINPPTAANS